MPSRMPKLVNLSNVKRRRSSSILRRLVRCVAFLPLLCLLLERVLLFPFEDGDLSRFLDVERIAVTSTIKTKQESNLSIDLPSTITPEKVRKSLESLTQPFSVTDTSSLRCQSRGTKIIAGYHHLGMTTTFAAKTKVPTNQRQKIPRILHQQGTTRCIPSALFDLHEEWKKELSFDSDRGEGWSMYFHTEDAMTRFFRTIVNVQGKVENSKHSILSKIGEEFPHLGQILRNCVDDRSFSKLLVWQFLCLYVYGGMYVNLKSGLSSKHYVDVKEILRDSYDTALLWTDIEDGKKDANRPKLNHNHTEVRINPHVLAVSPGHPLMYYAVQHALLEVTTETYSGEDLSFNDSNTFVKNDIMSNVLKRAVSEFIQEQNLNSIPTLSDNNLKTSSKELFRKTIYYGMDNKTTTILSSRPLERSQLLKGNQALPFKSDAVVGIIRLDSGKSRETPSCLRKLLVDASSIV